MFPISGIDIGSQGISHVTVTLIMLCVCVLKFEGYICSFVHIRPENVDYSCCCGDNHASRVLAISCLSVTKAVNNSHKNRHKNTVVKETNFYIVVW